MVAAIPAPVSDPALGPSASPPPDFSPPPPSPRRYEALHAFELQAPTRVIEWALGKREWGGGGGRPRDGS